MQEFEKENNFGHERKVDFSSFLSTDGLFFFFACIVDLTRDHPTFESVVTK